MDLTILFGVFTAADADRHPDRLLPRHRQLRDRALPRPAAARGVPARRLRRLGLHADGDPVLHLRRRPDGAGRHRRAHRRLRRLADRPRPRRPRPGQHRRLDALRRHLGLGRRRGGRGRRHHDPADEGARLRRRLRGQRHLDGGADRAAAAAVAQHDHLLDLRRRPHLDRRPLHRRHHPRPAARARALDHRLHRRPPPRLPDRALPGLRPRRPAVPDLAPRPAAHRHHLRRRALGRLHRHRELLRRGALRAPRHRCSSTATSPGREFVHATQAGGAHHLDGAADHRHGRRLRLADGLPARSRR